VRYIDTNTDRYPLFIGDVQLEAPSWEPGVSLPNGWFEVEETSMPIATEENIIYYEDAPELVDGAYIQKWSARQLSQEELDRMLLPHVLKTKLVGLGLTDIEADFLLRRVF
jgi:hypothetical protein